jgi:hypothetical protein
MNIDDLEGGLTEGFSPMQVFESLLPQLPAHRVLAEALATSYPESDLPERLAIVGFTLKASIDRWSAGHVEHVQEYREREQNAEALSWHEEESEICVQISCLALGYVLGARNSNEINDTDVFHSECLLPGFLMLHSGHFGKDSESPA